MTSRLPPSTLDAILTLQIGVAWAGEAGSAETGRRLGWWRTDLVSEFGGEDLFRALTPKTWAWTTLQAAREAARRTDARQRQELHNPDGVYSLFHFGPGQDDRLDERLAEHKRSGRKPDQALPGLRGVLREAWDPTTFFEWAQAQAEVTTVEEPGGRRVEGTRSTNPERTARKLVAALAPLTPTYPLPHFRIGP